MVNVSRSFLASEKASNRRYFYLNKYEYGDVDGWIPSQGFLNCYQRMKMAINPQAIITIDILTRSLWDDSKYISPNMTNFDPPFH